MPHRHALTPAASRAVVSGGRDGSSEKGREEAAGAAEVAQAPVPSTQQAPSACPSISSAYVQSSSSFSGGASTKGLADT